MNQPDAPARPTSFREPHAGFHEVRNGEHLCTACLNRPRLLPQEGSLWWSRERPRHVIRLVGADSTQVVFDLLYHPLMVVPGQQPKRTSRQGMATDWFQKKYIVPCPDDEERQPGQVWVHLERDEPVVLQHWGEMVRVRSTTTLDGRWMPSNFLDEFVPSGGVQRRTWMERLMDDEDSV